MRRIEIHWESYDVFSNTNTISGIVHVFNKTDGNENGKLYKIWRISVDLTTIDHYPYEKNCLLPEIQKKLDNEISNMARAYYDGFMKRKITHHWIEK